ncbi:MAG: AAA family ATPase [Bacteroidales bacterium]|nr:AAA family ATPase [Bacteroidales bacterium]
MKLRNLHINHYKNLNSSFSFEDNTGYISLIGLNGSGKSNLLEAISLLFAHIMGIKVTFPFSQYSITYDIREHGVDITDGDSLENGAIKEGDLPSSLIACYSGEDNRLWDSGFNSYYVDFFNNAIGGGEYKPKVLYINKLCWKIAFLSLLFSEDDEVKNFITDKLHIDIESVNVQFITKEGANPQAHDASNWYNRVISKYADSRVQINDLKNDEDVDLGCSKYPELTNDQIVFYYLYFLHMPDKSSEPALSADKVIENIDISVNGYNFDDLSEGEKKLILINCITKVLGDENSLVLLDEPDAHTHIAMKKDLLKFISEFKGQTVMTTHSPMFVKMIQDDNQDNLFYIEKGKIVESKNSLIKKLSNDTLTVLDGSLYSTSNSYLLVEGKSDVNCIKTAIKRFPDYRKLEDVSIISFNGASEAKELFEQAFRNSMDCVNKLVFLFDYDSAGLKGWTDVETIINEFPDKCKRIFYQRDYDTDRLPSSIKPSDSVLLEDLVTPDAYQACLDRIHSISSFHDLHSGGNISEKPIKDYIENHCESFTSEQMIGFSQLLMKLSTLF